MHSTVRDWLKITNWSTRFFLLATAPSKLLQIIFDWPEKRVMVEVDSFWRRRVRGSLGSDPAWRRRNTNGWRSWCDSSDFPEQTQPPARASKIELCPSFDPQMSEKQSRVNLSHYHQGAICRAGFTICLPAYHGNGVRLDHVRRWHHSQVSDIGANVEDSNQRQWNEDGPVKNISIN